MSSLPDLRIPTVTALCAVLLLAPLSAAIQGQQPNLNLSQLNLQPGDLLTVPAGAVYTVDMQPTPDLGGVFVQGILVFKTDLVQPELRASWILVTGTLRIGTNSSPVPPACTAKLTLIKHATIHSDPTATVTIAETVPTDRPDLLNALNDHGLVIYETGKLQVHGEYQGDTWTELNQTAAAGSSAFEVRSSVAELSGWGAGDEIVIASTDFDWTQAEIRSIGSVSQINSSLSGITLGSGQTLTNKHWGATESAANNSTAAWSVEERAEVGLLNRNVVFRTQEHNGSNWGPGTGNHGHVMLMRGDEWSPIPVGKIECAEFLNLGIFGRMGRYPLHFHETGDQNFGSWVRYCSFRSNFNKFMSLHDTQEVEVIWNVGYDTIGQGFYLEDAKAERNIVEYNLGLGTKAITPPPGVNPPVGDDDREPGTFWFASADNKIANNRAAGSTHYGFWYSPGVADDPFLADGTNAFFKNNVAHSNGHHGIYQDKVFSEANPKRARPFYILTLNAGTGLYEGQFQMKDCTAYKNRRYGIWVRSYGRLALDGMHVADNRSGFYLASDGIQNVVDINPGGPPDWRTLSWITLQNSIAIGESNNTGQYNPSWPHELEALRSLPQLNPKEDGGSPSGRSHELDWAYLTGIDIYDGMIELEKVRFAKLPDRLFLDLPGGGEAHRLAAAVSQVAYDSQYSADPRNRFGVLEFDEIPTDTVAHRIAFRYPTLQAQGANMIRNTVIHDLGGTLTTLGHGGIYLLPTEPFLVEGVTYNTALAAEGVWQVDRVNADYASVMIEPVSGPDTLGWIKTYHQYPPPLSGQITQVVRTILGDTNPTTLMPDRFPWAVALNKEYSVSFLNESKTLMTPPNSVDVVVRFAEQENQWLLIGISRPSAPLSVAFNDAAPQPSAADVSAVRNSSSNAWCYDTANAAVVIKMITKIPPPATDLIMTGTQDKCEIR